MSKGDPIPQLPGGAPKVGEVYTHYKGDSYRVVSLVLHANDGCWMVVYAPMHEVVGVEAFTRPLSEWGDGVEWDGKKVKRFSKV